MTGALLPQGQFYRLKAAFRDLVEKAGGLERAATRTGYGKSSLQRWASPEHPDFMPLTAALMLESDTGCLLVTGALAALHGHVLVNQQAVGETDTQPQKLFEQWVGLVKAFTDMAGGMSAVMADGEVTVAEARVIDEKAAALQHQIENMRKHLASHNSKPLKAVS